MARTASACGSEAVQKKPKRKRKVFRRGVWVRMDTCICMADSLCCLPETITTLLISYVRVK